MTLEFAQFAIPINIGPIELEMKRTLAKLVGSRYPDTFDWGTYDRITRMLGETPRGGVVYSTTFKLVNHHSSCSKCHYAFELDTYGRGCFHNCAYCYAKDQLESHGYWNRPQPFPVNLAEIRKIFYTVFETEKPNKWRDILEKKVPLRLGSMSDCFMWLDTKYGVTKELLKILRFYQYPYIVFTRSDLVAHDDYLPLIDPQLATVQMSIVGNNQTLTRYLEPGAPSYRRRLVALKKMRNAGIWTTVRINPLFPKHPDGFLTDHETVTRRFGTTPIPTLNLYNEEFIQEIAETGTKSILVGFVRLSPIAIKNMTRAIDIDLKSFFLPSELAKPGDKRYSDREIAAYYNQFKTQCASAGVRFSTCYIGNGLKDYYQYQDSWANKQDCCDVVGNVSSFRTTSQMIDWDTRIKQASCKQEAMKSQSQEILADETNKKHCLPSANVPFERELK